MVVGILGCEAQLASSCYSETVIAIPSRPAFANATDTTQCGVMELEYGFARQWINSSTNQNALGGGIRFGLTPKLDFHWSSNALLNLEVPDGTHRGFGDTYLGLKYRLSPQSHYRPAFGLMYMGKIPTADEREGLGTGEADHAFSFLVSKDVQRWWHADFNVMEVLSGRTGGQAFDSSTQFGLTNYFPIKGPLTFVAEPYGGTEANAAAPAFASLMVGLTYKLNPRTYLDGGVDCGVTSTAPSKRVYVGLTYAMGNVYAWARGR